jgi:hypothetical protein
MLSGKSGGISGIRPAPDIRYSAFRLAGYLAGRIYGKIRPVSGASLVAIGFELGKLF